MNDLFNSSINGSDIAINVCKSAPNQIQPLPLIQEVCQYWQSKGYNEILDVGCGYLRNSIYLSQYFSVHAFDFPQIIESTLFKNRLELIKNNRLQVYNPKSLTEGKLRVDASIVSLVLHIVPDVKTRQEIILNVKRNLKTPYEIFIVVPNGEKYYRKKASTHYNDGYLLHCSNGQKTFYREYTAKQIDQLMFELGFKLCKTLYTKKKILMRFYQSS
jgi:hypothetical protein